MRKQNKKAIEMGFNWLFAIIAGAVILFIAIYATSKIIGTGTQYTQTESAARLSNLLSEAGIASGKSNIIEFSKETRTYYGCDIESDFGRNTIAFSEKLFNKWSEKGGEITVNNKYIFANEVEEGELYVSSQPFFMPFKVADLIFISTDKYCFVEPPNDIESDISNLDNVKLIDSSEDCEGIRVCFTMGYSSTANCNITVIGDDVEFSRGTVKKNGKGMYYTDGLLYGAIFSNEKIYECNVKRLMKKFNELAEIYDEKMNIIQCGENLKSELLIMKNDANNLDSSSDLQSLAMLAKSIDQKNKGNCNVYMSQ